MKRNFHLGGIVGFLLISGIGLFLLLSRYTQVFTQASYNLSFELTHFAAPDVKSSGVVIVYLDEETYKHLGQSETDPLDRRYDADLVNHLRQDGARAVIMDVVFSDPAPRGKVESDEKFAAALRADGRVILGVDFNRPEADVLETRDHLLTYPCSPFNEAAGGVGLVQLTPDPDLVVRKHFRQLEPADLELITQRDRTNVPPSLSWAAAKMLGLPVTRNSAEQERERWVYYYGPPDEAIPGVGFSEALERPAGYFKDKIVFVGARPITSLWYEKRDEMRSPYSTGGKKFSWMPMVEIHATEFLNLMRQDWLTRPPRPVEAGLLLLSAFILGFGFLRVRAANVLPLAIIGALVTALLVQSVFGLRHIWFSWLIIVGAQIPAALLYSFFIRSVEWYVKRRKLEEEQRRAYERIHEQAALLDKAADAIIVHDLEWRARYWNKSAETLYGWDFEAVQKLNLKTDVFKSDDTRLLEALQECLANGEWSGDLKQCHKSGKTLIVQSRWTLVRDEQGKAKSVLVINTDVTDQKKLENQFLRTQRMESIGTLAGGIAHDLNNVLSPILMGVDVLRMKGADPFTDKLLGTMAASARRGSDMVKQVLTFARGHEGDKTALQIGHLIKEMQKIVKETFPKTIEFKTSMPEQPWPIMGDATQMHQIILNLCVNARDAMPDGGKITVEARNVALSEEQAAKFHGARAGQYVLLSVADTGTGIPPEIMDKIFEPFFTTKEIGKGTGLGLSTVISIIKGHGGFLDLQSKVGQGTAFNVYLPADETAAPIAAVAISADALKGNGETIMVVDDEPAILELTQHLLTHYGYKVVSAIHGADALALYPQCRDRLKVVIMDMMMPVMDGASAIRALRKQDSELPVIAISGLMANDKIHERLGGEEVMFVAKPFSAEKLLLAVREALTTDPPGEERTDSTKVGGVTV